MASSPSAASALRSGRFGGIIECVAVQGGNDDLAGAGKETRHPATIAVLVGGLPVPDRR